MRAFIQRTIIGRMFAGAAFAVGPNEAAASLARHGAKLRKEQGRALAYTRLEELRADIASGRIAHLGWKQ